MASKAKAKKSIEELLKAAGFQTLETPNDRIIHASGTDDFSKSHAAFLQSARKHPALIGCSELPSLGKRVLIVHRNNVDAVSSPRSIQPEKRGEDPASTEESD